ncbi:hypothetical protein KR018_011807 [Drosophila ironensis]|nr:hypothetical protein KR018_011807 [Drosophila ironensis]
MHDIFGSLDGLFLGLPGHYSIALTTLLVCVLTALYFANFFKDKAELEDEGLGSDEPREEDEQEEEEEEERRLSEEETEDDEAYGENSTDSDDGEYIEEPEELGLGMEPQIADKNYNRMMGQLTPNQILEERRIERQQLAVIFELLRKQEAELNLQDRISEQDLKQQVRLYR